MSKMLLGTLVLLFRLPFNAIAYESCKEIQDADPKSAQDNKAYELDVDCTSTSIYCHMTPINECGGGAWTLVMKIDGSKSTFSYDSNFWTNEETYNEGGGQSGFDDQETKLQTYWSTPFTRICLAMKVGDQIKFLAIDQRAASLHSLIADGKYRSTSVGRDAWRSLLSASSLQSHCNKEGFNAVAKRAKARIGILANNENDCSTPDSRVGFGTTGYPDNSNTCGNVARHGGDLGDKNIKSMGYIFVGTPSPVYSSCQEFKNANQGRAASNKAYELTVDSRRTSVYCHMTTINECGGGAWTLAMKIDGSKNTFDYHSNYWTDKNAYNEKGGETGFDRQETKLPTYWDTPFTRICLGMEVGGKMNFLPIDKQAPSLHSLIADGKYRSTTIGRDGWKDLVTGSSLQWRCNREGFNVVADEDRFSKARIGIIGNNENDCTTTDSRVGFGTGGYPDDGNSCGYISRHGGDSGDRSAKAMGYVFIGSPPPTRSHSTCAELQNAEPDRASSNKAYELTTAAGTFPAYCHMTTLSGCGPSSGWTLVMKMDGSKGNFHYDSSLWTNKDSYNMKGGVSGFDYEETKLPTYWTTPFTKLCLGMRVSGQTKFLVINQKASSLFSLIADDQYRPTSLQRDAWKSLISGSSLQRNCNREGFNANVGSLGCNARIGITSNNEGDCNTNDSRIGFGTGGHPDNSNTCGFIARHGGDNGDKDAKAIGYILVM